MKVTGDGRRARLVGRVSRGTPAFLGSGLCREAVAREMGDKRDGLAVI